MDKNLIFKGLSFAAIIGNIIYILWIIYNGINEGFNATPVQFAAYIGIILLLALNAVLLSRKTQVQK